MICSRSLKIHSKKELQHKAPLWSDTEINNLDSPICDRVGVIIIVFFYEMNMDILLCFNCIKKASIVNTIHIQIICKCEPKNMVKFIIGPRGLVIEISRL